MGSPRPVTHNVWHPPTFEPWPSNTTSGGLQNTLQLGPTVHTNNTAKDGIKKQDEDFSHVATTTDYKTNINLCLLMIQESSNFSLPTSQESIFIVIAEK